MPDGDATPPPLVRLDPGGTATPISYNVPEPFSYSGQNYLAIPLPDAAFRSVRVNSPGAAEPHQVVADAMPVARARRADQPTPARRRALLVPPGVRLAPRGAGSTLAPARLPGGATPADVVVPHGQGAAAGVPGDAVRGSTQDRVVDPAAQPTSPRLAALSYADVAASARAGSQTVLFHNVAGQLDFRTVPMLTKDGPPGPVDPGDDPDPTALQVAVTAPAAGADFHGPQAGITMTVIGTLTVYGQVAGVSLSVTVDGGASVPVPYASNGSWSADVTLTSSGAHTILVRASGTTSTAGNVGKQRTVNGSRTVAVTVVLDQGGGAPAQPPSVAIDTPVTNAIVIGSDPVQVDVSGKVAWAAGHTVTSVTVTDQATGETTDVGPFDQGVQADWQTPLLLKGYGPHQITVVARDDQPLDSQSASVTVVTSDAPPFRRLVQRLLLVETLNLSSFLGAFGAGRCVKTMSLLPGEKTTISVHTWTKDSTSRKDGSSIVDSSAADSSDDFQDSLDREQTSKESLTETSNYKVSGEVKAAWGWGEAKIDAEVSGSANATRDNAVKNVSNATRKHSMKASNSREVNVNTEYTSASEVGTDLSTTREISNVNVARVLNFVFRQMNQEHITLMHLSDVRAAVYTEDLMLDATGEPILIDDPDHEGQKVFDVVPTYREFELCEIDKLLDAAVVDGWRDWTTQAIQNALSGIPDYQDTLHSAFETVTPTDGAGNPVAGAEYMRFPRGLTQQFVDPHGGMTFSVPGIILSYDYIVMRTEGVLVDAVLGEGDGLDLYSHGLQDVVVAERQVAVDERRAQIAQLELARSIVATGDTAQAQVYATVFPPTPRTPTIDVVTTPSPSGT